MRVDGQVAGKSLRQSMHSSSISGRDYLKSGREFVSLNEVMYARMTKVPGYIVRAGGMLRRESKTGDDQISRGAASRVLKSIFTDAAEQKRIPRRLVNLIPIVQEMAGRLRGCDIKKLADDVMPLNPSFRKFMSDNSGLKKLVTARERRKSLVEPADLLPSALMKAIDAGYLSQEDGEDAEEDRKRKRREDAVVSVSDPAMYARSRREIPAAKKRRLAASTCSPVPISQPQTNLEKLQEHKGEIKELLACTTPKRLVYRFVRKLVAAIIPKRIWADVGAKKNWKSVRQLLRKLVFARKFDLLSLKKVRSLAKVTCNMPTSRLISHWLCLVRGRVSSAEGGVDEQERSDQLVGTTAFVGTRRCVCTNANSLERSARQMRSWPDENCSCSCSSGC